ncbi:hypothetical protein A0J61_11105 [Choanephora cucurbitarum]|uniref:Uncharacterized protein n=1 Tax=Choanephora cucurbitarum TaxID=101091 RepID=A0A1C7MWL5_9FUNG|nr:hypothetical protein A0J61_11105 [Choanephora cucurbitarum]
MLIFQLNDTLETTEKPADLLLRRAMPQVETPLQGLKNQTSVLASQVQSLTTLVQGFHAFPAAVFQQLEPFLQINTEAHSMMQQWNRIASEGVTLDVRLHIPESSHQAELPASSLSLNITEPSVAFNPPILQTDPSPSILKSSLTITTASHSTQTALVPSGSLELNIKAFRNVKTLSALWRIWFDGLPGHHPHLQA